jgi:hypothetical protein
MTTAMANRMLRPVSGPLGVRHALMVYVAPRALFNRVEDTGAYGYALLTLIGLVMLIGYAKVQTGLVDRNVEMATEKKLADLETNQRNLVDRVQLKEAMEAVRKEAVFSKTITRLGVIVLQPIYLLGSFLLIASVLYAMVALTGRKPEYHTLMSICVYAGFIELTGYVVELLMMFYYRSTEVGTSLTGLGTGVMAKVLGGVDPFRIWFWVLVAIGLIVTQQLSRRMAMFACTMLGVFGAAVHVGLAFASGGGNG